MRANFADFEFDELGCIDGLKALRAYRKEWDEERGRWKDKPRHDWASHGADALRYVIMAHRPTMRTKLDDDGNLLDPFEPREIKVLVPVGPDQVGVTLDEVFELNERPKRQQRI